MESILSFWRRKEVFVCGAGIAGNVLLLVGIVTAALNTAIAGLTPVVWILLSFICYVTMIFSVVLNILHKLEASKP
jgi:hypothetical protein